MRTLTVRGKEIVLDNIIYLSEIELRQRSFFYSVYFIGTKEPINVWEHIYNCDEAFNKWVASGEGISFTKVINEFNTEYSRINKTRTNIIRGINQSRVY